MLILGCFKEKNPQFSSVNFIQKKNSQCNRRFNKDKCLENFPQIKGPYPIEEKARAILIISKYFCLSDKKNLNSDPKQLVKDKFMEENIDLELINSYDVIKISSQISNLISNSCDIKTFDDERLLNIIKSEIKQINTK